MLNVEGFDHQSLMRSYDRSPAWQALGRTISKVPLPRERSEPIERHLVLSARVLSSLQEIHRLS
jgi:hypothetical protein